MHRAGLSFRGQVPWFVDLSLASGQTVQIGLEFLKDFNKGKCSRQPPSLKYQEKDAVLRKYKEQRKVEKKQRAKHQKAEQKQMAASAPTVASVEKPKPKPTGREKEEKDRLDAQRRWLEQKRVEVEQEQQKQKEEQERNQRLRQQRLQEQQAQPVMDYSRVVNTLRSEAEAPRPEEPFWGNANFPPGSQAVVQQQHQPAAAAARADRFEQVGGADPASEAPGKKKKQKQKKHGKPRKVDLDFVLDGPGLRPGMMTAGSFGGLEVEKVDESSGTATSGSPTGLSVKQLSDPKKDKVSATYFCFK